MGGGRTGVGGVVSAHCRALEWVELRVTAPRGLAPQSGRRPKNTACFGFRGRSVEVSAN
jgi:hypothetical protein